MRMAVHHYIGKKIYGELKGLGLHVHKSLFLLGNLYPDLIHSYLWCRHEYQHSQHYLQKKLLLLKKKPVFFSFHLGIVTHYICDYFCYPHSGIYDKNMFHHIRYELNQKIPANWYRAKLEIKSFTIEELEKFVRWYEGIRAFFTDDESDFYIASMVASNFLQAAY
jgi:hypothetical protein